MRQDGMNVRLQMMTVCGAGLVIVLALVWLSVTGAAQETGNTVPVCVGADRVLRFVEDEKNCKVGEQRFLLASVTAESKSEEPEAKKPPAKKPDQSSEKDSTNRDGLATKVTAPFEVVDKQGRTIMRVQDSTSDTSRGVNIYNDQGRVAAHVGVLISSGGGRVMARNSGGDVSRYVQMSYPAEGPHFAMKGDNDKLLLLINSLGSVWYNNNEVPAVSLGAGESGNKGVLKVADENGTAVVEAGSLQGGRGVVRVYPSRGQTPLQIPQFLLGSKP